MNLILAILLTGASSTAIWEISGNMADTIVTEEPSSPSQDGGEPESVQTNVPFRIEVDEETRTITYTPESV